MTNQTQNDEVFCKCPKHDKTLKEWHPFFPKLTTVTTTDPKTFKDGEEAYFDEYIKFLSEMLQIEDPTGKCEFIYALSESEIKEVMDSYAGGSWNSSDLRNKVEEKVNSSRDKWMEDHFYINHKLRDWDKYDTPHADKGEYKISKWGILREVKNYNEDTGDTKVVCKDVCRTPFVLCGISQPLNDESIYYKIRQSTRKENEIKEFWASQSSLLSKKELKTLFNLKGINCPENALLLETMEYISKSILEFGSRFKKEFSSKLNGWNEDKSLFILGNRGISAKGIERVLSVNNGKGFPELDKKGTIEGWVSGTRGLLGYDLVRFKCYDALSAPLKALLGIESHASDHYGNTSCGKTFTAQIALSMIGDAEGLTIGAKSTTKGILVHIRDFSDLPILIDESSDAGEHLADLVYPLTSNKGRIKSTVDGQRDGGEEFHTTTMFTGEKPIRDCLQNSGQQYRVNELDDTLPDLPTKEINAVKTAIRENHGHIIELYLSRVIAWYSSGQLQDLYNSCFDMLPENSSNIEGRSRSIFACIMTAGYLLEEVFQKIGMPTKKPNNVVKSYFKKCIQDKPIELEYIRALRVVLDWVHSEYGRFGEVNLLYDDVTTRDKTKRYGWIDSDFIDIIGSEFTKKMKDEGFSPSKIKVDWADNGIAISNDPKRKGVCRFTREKKTIAGIRINRAISEDLTGLHHSYIEEDSGLSQDEKVKKIFRTVRFLTEECGTADLNLIRQIVNIPDLDELLRIFSLNGKLLKLDQNTYKSIL